MDLFPLVKDLTELNGPVGHEQPVAHYLLERWSRSCERVFKTPVGNVVGVLGGTGPRLLLEAHMDEINPIVKSIDARGFLWLTAHGDLARALTYEAGLAGDYPTQCCTKRMSSTACA